jgi:hypothetical protein
MILIFLEEEMRLNTGLLETTFMILVMQIKGLWRRVWSGRSTRVHPTEQYGALRTSSYAYGWNVSKVMQIL